MSENHEMEELDVEVSGSGLDRRRFLRSAGIAGITAAWTAPLIQTVAYATGTHPPPGSPFTPGECPPSRTTTGDTHDKPPDHGDGQGCTPGFWKNHTSAWAATGYSPSADFDSTFGVNLFNPNITLLQAAGLGGGGVQAMARHAVAALLNAAHPNIDYPMSTSQVINVVKFAAVTGKFEDAKDLFEQGNELGCPISH
jgi:hypothetical protein